MRTDTASNRSDRNKLNCRFVRFVESVQRNWTGISFQFSSVYFVRFQRSVVDVAECQWRLHVTMLNGSSDFLSDDGNWTWTWTSPSPTSPGAEARRNCTNCAAVRDPDVQLLRHCLSVCLSLWNCAAVRDPGVELLRHVVEVWLTTPIVLLGIVGNVVAFFVLCQHRRHKLQTTTAILQVINTGRPTLCHLLTTGSAAEPNNCWGWKLQFFERQLQISDRGDTNVQNFNFFFSFNYPKMVFSSKF